MTITEIYIRLLTELQHDIVRLNLQDVLVELRTQSANQLGISSQESQESAEETALYRKIGKPWEDGECSN